MECQTDCMGLPRKANDGMILTLAPEMVKQFTIVVDGMVVTMEMYIIFIDHRNHRAR